MAEKINEGYKPSSETKRPNPQDGYKPTKSDGDNPINKPPKKP